MRLVIPTYIETLHRDGNRDPVYRCRPLLQGSPEFEHRELGRAMAKLAERLRKDITKQASGGEEKILAGYHYDSPVIAKTLKLRLDLRTSLPEVKYLIAQLPIPEGKISFSPSVPKLWFDVARGGSVGARATEVYSQYFRKRMKRSGSLPDLNSVQGKAWISSIEVDVNPSRRKKKEDDDLAALFASQPVNGEDELRRVGRSLRQRESDDLTRCVHRNQEIGEVARLLEQPDRRPLALVGPRMVGKSSILHEVVRQWIQKKTSQKHRKQKKQDVWLISPQRLVSGMQYVGQWEDRVLAILKHATKADQTLWFDDLPGLYLAGVTRDSKLSVADVLREHLNQPDRARTVFELTPEQLSLVREKDHRLADQLHIVPIDEPCEKKTTQILIASMANLELKHGCKFQPDVIPLVTDLTRRHERSTAQPGKAARLLTEIAVQHGKVSIGRKEALNQFQRKTGISLDLIDDETTLNTKQLLEKLEHRVVGQKEATQAVADVAVRAKSHLADPGRPLATMLFLGPTGVGKTHCARSMADLLFDNREGLIRLDMNEFVSPRAMSRLIGSPIEPEGLLTGPILRRPHSVVLLDEIEKAHPDVFDLLLQVLGEGRLTDYRGRTADFTQCVVVLTSNLGSQAASRRIQLLQGDSERTPIKAAEKFFRPELFNRIDQTIVFSRLNQEQIRQIVDSLLREVFARDGFARRRCLLDVHPLVRQSLAEAGFDPQYGARALRRAVEQKLCSPIAAKLSQINLDCPALIRVLPQADGICSNVIPLEECGLEYVAPMSAFDIARAAAKLLERTEEIIAELKPESGYSVGSQDPSSLRYYSLSDLAYQLRTELDNLERAPEMTSEHTPTNSLPHHQARRSAHALSHSHHAPSDRRILKEIASNDDINAYLDELAEARPDASTLANKVANSAALLNWLSDDTNSQYDSLHGVLWYRVFEGNSNRSTSNWLSFDPSTWICSVVQTAHRDMFGRDLGLAVEPLGERNGTAALSVSGAGAGQLAQRESGIHLLIDPGNMTGIRVDWIPTPRPIDNWDAFEEFGPQQWEQWMLEMAVGTMGVEDEPIQPGNVIRVYHMRKSDFISEIDAHDLRTGRKCKFGTGKDSLLNLFLDGLPRLAYDA